MFVVVDIVKAILARLILIVHALLAVWRVVEYKGDQIYWLHLLSLLGTLIDLFYILLRRKGEEWKWFSPSIFFYLGTTLPCIWWLELGRLYDEKARQDHVSSLKANRSQNSTTGIELFDELNSYIKFEPSQWTQFVEQVMLCLLIISRWLMPLKRNHITRDQLSQLLLVYLGLAADIVELLGIFDEPGLVKHIYFTFAILAAWSWSLMQFTLVLTATRGQAFHVGGNRNTQVADETDGNITPVEIEVEPVKKKSSSGCFCCENETWSIIVMLIMLDAPFLAIRLVAICLYGINTYTIYFFTGKNILVCILQMYRLIIVVAAEMRTKREEKKEESMRLKQGENNGTKPENAEGDVRRRAGHLHRSR